MNLEDLSPREREAARKEACDELVRAGDLRFLMHSDQRTVLAQMRATKQQQFVLEIARRYGKTWLMVADAVSTCLRFPKSRVPYGSSTDKSLREYVQPAMMELTDDFPADCRPVFNSFDGHWNFPNGSHIPLFGCEDNLKARRARGPPARKVYLDEGGFIPIVLEVIENVLRPMLMHLPIEDTPCSVVVGSSPASEPEHGFTKLAEIAEASGSYANRTIYDNPLLTPAQIENFIAKTAEANGLSVEQYMKTDTFQREYLARRVIDKLLVVLPEWLEIPEGKTRPRFELLVREVERPEFFDGMTVLDFGGNDPHFAHFSYWNFPLAKWVIEDELYLPNGENTAQLAKAIQDKERSVWGTNKWEGTLYAFESKDEGLYVGLPDWMRKAWEQSAPRQPRARWADNDIQLCRDLMELHGIAFIPTRKDDLELQVNRLRLMIQTESVYVHPRCVHTIRHWKGTTWKNAARTDFAHRGTDHGDGVATGIYGCRNLDRQRNPFPPGYGLNGMRDRRPVVPTLAAQLGKVLGR